MSILDFFRSRYYAKPKLSAAIAKERLQIILSRERVDASGYDYLPALKQDLLQVVAKYINVDLDNIKVNIERDGDLEVLELNVVLTGKGNPTATKTPAAIR